MLKPPHQIQSSDVKPSCVSGVQQSKAELSYPNYTALPPHPSPFPPFLYLRITSRLLTAPSLLLPLSSWTLACTYEEHAAEINHSVPLTRSPSADPQGKNSYS